MSRVRRVRIYVDIMLITLIEEVYVNIRDMAVEKEKSWFTAITRFLLSYAIEYFR